MKLSTLIKDLSTLQALHGDVEVITLTKTHISQNGGRSVPIEAYATDLVTSEYVENEGALVLNLEWLR